MAVAAVLVPGEYLHSHRRQVLVHQHGLPVEDGDLTPNLKVKRKAIEKKYASLLDSLYAGALESD